MRLAIGVRSVALEICGHPSRRVGGGLLLGWAAQAARRANASREPRRRTLASKTQNATEIKKQTQTIENTKTNQTLKTHIKHKC